MHITESMAENGACNLHLPWSKTQKARGDDVWIPCQEAPLDPIHAIHKHYIKNRLNIKHPIGAYRDAHDNIITLTRSKFVRCINRILRATGRGYPRNHGALLSDWGNHFLPCLWGATRYSEEVWTMAFSGFLGVLVMPRLSGHNSHRDASSQATN
ncbi:hypothetical protein L208DRAFT_1522999, partial [Tricholoma matsutake]